MRSHGVIQAQFAVLNEEHDRFRGELLGERGPLKNGSLRGRNAPFYIGKTISPGFFKLPVANDGDGRARNMASLQLCFDEAVNPVQFIRLPEKRGGKQAKNRTARISWAH